MKRPVIFGEVVFDIYPDGEAVLGGAPFNVAWHLRGFGIDPLMLGCVGDDENGRKVIERMEAWGMDTRGMQIDPEHPTGTVHVIEQNGEPEFNILGRQAYDFIDPSPPIIELLKEQDAGLVYHGSLALRGAVNRESLATFSETAGSPIFCDVNLRDPWWKAGAIERMLKNATWAKLNDDELNILCGADEPEEARELVEAYGLETIIVTKGGQGAFIVGEGLEQIEVTAPTDVAVIDPVGAGDAFSAVCILGIMRKWPWEFIAERAVDFAAQICAVKGATTQNTGIYQKALDRWGKPD